MLRQLERIDRVRALCAADPRVVAALQYGSFVRGEGDAFSDVEFYVFLEERCVEGFDREAWVREVAPLRTSLVNEYGTFVAIFDDWMRGEWHFEPPAAIERVRSWPLAPRDAANMLILDRDGRLGAALEAATRSRAERPDGALAHELLGRLLNWLLLGTQVLQRGERARAHAALGEAHRFLLWLLRLREGARQHWLTPSRALERDVSAASVARFAACAATLDAASLADAYASAWRLARELAHAARDAWGIDAHVAVWDNAEAQLSAWLGR